MLQGHVAWTCCAATIFLVCHARFSKKSSAGTKFCLRKTTREIQLVWIHASWSRDKMTSVSNVVSCVHCSCKLSALWHRNEPISASCVPASVFSLQHMSYAYTRRGLLHVSATCPLVCADLNERISCGDDRAWHTTVHLNLNKDKSLRDCHSHILGVRFKRKTKEKKKNRKLV